MLSLLTLFAAFSFLQPDAGRLSELMGFVTENPSAYQSNTAFAAGELGTLDSKNAAISISGSNVFFTARYVDFGELDIRGTSPDDQSTVPAYPYAFLAEIGAWKSLGRTRTGLSLNIFNQRIMDYSLNGYFLSLGFVYEIRRFSFSGFVRNIGGRYGYVETEKYTLPVFMFAGTTYKSRKNLFSLGLSMNDMTLENLKFSIAFSRKISSFLWGGVETLVEKDLSIGYREKYPVRFMLKAVKNNIAIGYLLKVPAAALDMKHTLFIGVKI